MKQAYTKSVFFVILLCVIIAGEVGFLFYKHQGFVYAAPSQEELLKLTTDQERAVWGNVIDSNGGVGAWEQFKVVYKSIEIKQGHPHAHIFGAELFEREGVAGVAACDAAFSFGCYHSFFASAISTLGLEVIHKLDEACIKRWGPKGLGCQHGIGHGVLWYTGTDHLVDALDACASLTWKEPIGGCSSGVFMENNFHAMDDPNITTTREYNPKDQNAPCNAIPERYQQSCYFEQPQWWSQVLAHDYVQLGKFCDGVRNRASRDACFRGFGSIAASDADYDIEKTVAICNKMPGSVNINMCLQGASWGFASQPSLKALAPQVCASLPLDQQEICDDGSDIYHDKNSVGL